jgi:hypothetical protein
MYEIGPDQDPRPGPSGDDGPDGGIDTPPQPPGGGGIDTPTEPPEPGLQF